jgi:hypothetical protein
MRILCCCPREYFGLPGTVSSDYIYFVESLRELKHSVHHYDHVRAAFDRDAMNEFFLSIVKRGGYDLVWTAMVADEFMPEALDEARRYSALLAWNSDDDVRWEEYSSHLYRHFTFMVTTSRHIYESNRQTCPNLVLSQWGCTGRYDGWNTTKDIDFSFVGRLYPNRAQEIRYLRRRQALAAYGKPPEQTLTSMVKTRLARKLGFRPSLEADALSSEAAVKGIWNRSKVSYTPLAAWNDDALQVKARVFDMGLSGTVMLCNVNPAIYEFYEPKTEYWEFGDLDECVSKAKYLLAHDGERQKIAAAYYRRTKAEHMWSKRFRDLFGAIGLPVASSHF